MQAMELREISHPKREAFLAAYAECGTVTHAAKAAGIDRRTHYQWMATDPEYVKSFEDAHIEACEHMEAEARRRGLEGYEEPVFGSGGQGVGTVEVGTIRKHSDTLLIFMMKGAMPHKYRERIDTRHEGTIDVKHSGSIRI